MSVKRTVSTRLLALALAVGLGGVLTSGIASANAAPAAGMEVAMQAMAHRLRQVGPAVCPVSDHLSASCGWVFEARS